MVADRLGDRVRVRVGNLTMTNHPIHIHGIEFEVTGTDGGPVPKTARWPEVTTDVAVGQMRQIELIADEEGDWAMHCHKSHHTMNAMGHDVPTMIGVDHSGVAGKIKKVFIIGQDYAHGHQVARAAKEAGIPFSLATGSITSMEEIAGEVGGTLWMQLYMWADRRLSHQLVKRAEKAGFEALLVTVDGAVAGNLALTGTATGGVYLGGGIAPKILPRLIRGPFLSSFTAKGRFVPYLERLPVRVVLNDRAALLGAARHAALLAG